MKQSKNKNPEIQNIVGDDGITYLSVISQPIHHGFIWDSSEEDMEYAHIYSSNFAYGMQIELIIFSNLRTGRLGILARSIGSPASSRGVRKNLNFVALEVLQSGSERIDTKSNVWILWCSVSASFKFEDCLITTSFRSIFYWIEAHFSPIHTSPRPLQQQKEAWELTHTLRRNSKERYPSGHFVPGSYEWSSLMTEQVPRRLLMAAGSSLYTEFGREHQI